MGWCHLIQLDYCAAELSFSYLKSWSRWSRAFYSYVAGICLGSCENVADFHSLKELRGSTTSCRGNQLDEYLARRAKCCPLDDASMQRVNRIFWKLLIYEMLYLWNALPSCNMESIEKIIQGKEVGFINQMLKLSV